MAGPFPVQGCGEKTHDFFQTMQAVFSYLSPAVIETNMSSPGPAYTTFFKTTTNGEFVRDILMKIVNGAAVSPRRNSGQDPVLPTFICVTRPKQIEFKGSNTKEHDAYDVCRTLADKNTPSFLLYGTRIIILCPAFFTHFPALPPQRPSSCLRVNAPSTGYDETGGAFLTYRAWVLLHEVVHYYLRAEIGAHSDIFNVNRCIRLPAEETVKNVQSYVYYVANIYLGCTNFPQRIRSYPAGFNPRVELLESDGNSTSSERNRSLFVNSTIAILPDSTRAYATLPSNTEPTS